MARYLCMAVGFVLGALLVGVLGEFELPREDLRWPCYIRPGYCQEARR